MGTLAVPEFKVILCGEYGVGKTSTFRRFLNDSFVDTSKMSLTQTRQTTLGMMFLSLSSRQSRTDPTYYIRLRSVQQKF